MFETVENVKSDRTFCLLLTKHQFSTAADKAFVLREYLERK